MKRIRECEWCGRPLESYNRGAICYHCQEKRQEALDRHLEILNIELTVKEVALKRNISPGHVRRILEHPEKYPWRYYGITEAYKPGKEWKVFLAPLEHRKELAKQLVNIGEGALNVMTINTILGPGPVLTANDIQSVLECQIRPLPRRKTPREREGQKKRIRGNVDRYVDQFFDAMTPIVEGKLNEMELMRTIASTGRQLRTLDAGHEHQRQPNLSNAGS